MTIQMYDLAGADPALRFSPYCWRTRMALAHKGLAVETIPWRFMDRDKLAPSGQARVPVIVDKGKWVHDSWKIALYLDETYPERPLMRSEAERASARLIGHWADTKLHALIPPLAVLSIYNHIDAKDKPYFLESREKRFGKTLEAVTADPKGSRERLIAGIAPLEMTLGEFTYFGGSAPNYVDYTLFGSLMFAYTMCPEPPLDTASAIGRWFERMLDLHGGIGRKAKTVRKAG